MRCHRTVEMIIGRDDMSRLFIVCTKIDVPNANIPMVRMWLEQAGRERIFCVNNDTGEGVQDIVDHLCQYSDKLSLEEVKENQKKGLKDRA